MTYPGTTALINALVGEYTLNPYQAGYFFITFLTIVLSNIINSDDFSY